MIYAPLLLSPLTDFSYFMAPNHRQQDYRSLCGQLELKFMDCLEAYGCHKAKTKCAAVLYDMHECNHKTFQILRAKEISKQRMKLYREGKLKTPFDEYPALDSYLYL